MDYFVHSKEAKALTKSDLSKLEEFSRATQTQLRNEILSDGKLSEFEFELRKDTRLAFTLSDRNSDIDEETDDMLYGYWVTIHEPNNADIGRLYQLITDLCNKLDFVYDDPQRGKENLDPHELINPLYSKQELEKLENDKLRFSKENSIKLQKRIADESFSEIYLVSPTSTITKIEVQNPQRHEAEKLAMQTSHDNLVVYVFMYKNSGSVVYYFDQMRILSIDCDADAGVATLLEENKNLVKKLKINKHKLEELVSTPVDDLYEFISSILAFSGIVLKSF